MLWTSPVAYPLAQRTARPGRLLPLKSRSTGFTPVLRLFESCWIDRHALNEPDAEQPDEPAQAVRLVIADRLDVVRPLPARAVVRSEDAPAVASSMAHDGCWTVHQRAARRARHASGVEFPAHTVVWTMCADFAVLTFALPA